MTSDIGSVLVAGASQGIGEGVALAFASAGAEVVLGGRRKDALDAAADRIGATTGRRPSIVSGDFAARDVSPLLAKLPDLDVLVVNYGDTDAPAGFDTSEDAWDRLLNANLTGPARLSRHVARAMVARGKGTILFIGSICGHEVLGAPIGYNVGKAGLRALTKTMARELGPKGVRVNMIDPGNILFDGGRWAQKRAADPDRIDRMIAANVPLQRFGTPADIGEAAVFLCSSKASFITGADLLIDGGQTTGI
jgi:3-oxoacyl-[acyl-carrier protein] reductase